MRMASYSYDSDELEPKSKSIFDEMVENDLGSKVIAGEHMSTVFNADPKPGAGEHESLFRHEEVKMSHMEGTSFSWDDYYYVGDVEAYLAALEALGKAAVRVRYTLLSTNVGPGMGLGPRPWLQILDFPKSVACASYYHTHSSADGYSMRIHLQVTSKDEAELLGIHALLKNLSHDPPSKKNKLHVLMPDPGGPKLKELDAGPPADLEPGNYTPAVRQAFEHMVSCLLSKEPCGRLSIFNGSPGTGKTYLLRSLLSKADKIDLAVIPSNMIGSLGEPSLYKALYDLSSSTKGNPKPLVLLLEDADIALVSREKGSFAALSNLLNFGDGFLGRLLDLRIIATTNAKKVQIDEAILRPGRLCVYCSVGHLPAKQAGEVFRRLTGSEQEFGEKTTLAEVYRLARKDGWSPEEKNVSAAGQYL